MNNPGSPLISAVIPTFNRADIIPISLKSAIEQTYENLEIIVIDDCSEDETKRVVEEYKDSRIRYIRHDHNLGGAAARNSGIDAARGDYIAFLDSDDAWVPNKMALQYSLIRSHPEPTNTVSYTQVYHSLEGISSDTFNEFDSSQYLPKRGKHCAETIGDYIICHKGKTLTSTLMLHQSLAQSVRFRDKLRKHQDWDFCLRLEAAGANFIFLDQPLTIWNGDSRFEHVGRNPNYELSELWLTECRQYLSGHAAVKFSLEKILPEANKKKDKKVTSSKSSCSRMLK